VEVGARLEAVSEKAEDDNNPGGISFLTREWFVSIRQRLIRFFAAEGCPDPQNCADETIFRVARALSKGARIEVKPATFAYAVAKLVEKECRRKRDRLKESQADDTTHEPPAPGGSDCAALHLCLEKCLSDLSPFERALIIRYYEGTRPGEDKKNRKELAERLRMPAKKLVKEATKIRQKLERCISRCLEDGEGGPE
jgi:DNA-directed RNA polymerase specialized sigma24 family protein